MLKEFLHSTYSHLKGIKLCGNLLVRNIFTSDIRYLPNVMEQFGAAKLPKEMSFHVPKGSNFTDLYNFITFPTVHSDKSNIKENVLVTKKHHVICEPVGMENVKPPETDNNASSVRVNDSNRTVTGQVTDRVHGRKQHKTSVITTAEAAVVDKRPTKVGVSNKQEKRSVKSSSEETKVRMISLYGNKLIRCYKG